MIPVPQSELQLYDIENELDSAYKDLVQNEIIFIRKNQKRYFRMHSFYINKKQKMICQQVMGKPH